jgi:hypothetical protein
MKKPLFMFGFISADEARLALSAEIKQKTKSGFFIGI